MNPLDRINQLNDEVALLHSQLSDARKQLDADSATIAKLAKDKQELASALPDVEFLLRHPFPPCVNISNARFGTGSTTGNLLSSSRRKARQMLSCSRFSSPDIPDVQ
jgi:hypothetical protein